MNSHLVDIIKNSFGSSIVKVLGIAATLALSIFLARQLGPGDFGVLMLSLRILNVIVIVATFGMGSLVLKEVAIGVSELDNTRIASILKTSYILNGGILLLLVILLFAGSRWIASYVFNMNELFLPLRLVALSLIPMVFSRIHAGALAGYGKVWQSNLVNKALSQVVTLVIVALALIIKSEISLVHACLYYFIGRVFVSIIIGFLWKRTHGIFEFFLGQFKRVYVKTAMPIFLVGATGVLSSNIDVVFLGIFGTAEDIGFYSVASRVGLLIAFFLQVTNSSVSPKIASLYFKNELKELEGILQKVNAFLFLFGTVCLISIVFFGKHILLLWGQNYTTAYGILVVLAIGQVVNVSTGSIGQIMVLTGNQKVMGSIAIQGLILNLILNFSLAKFFGAYGVAIAVTSSMIYINLRAYFFAKNNLSIKGLRFL